MNGTHLRLVSTDFDGTIVDWESPPFISPDFFDAVRDLQKRGGVWAINTGRSIPQLEEGIIDLRFPIEPDYIITLERAVHHRPGKRGSWEDFGDWNRRCDLAHERLHREAEEIYREVTAYAAKQKGLMTPVSADGWLDGLIAVNNAQMDEAVEFLKKLQPRLPDLNFQRNGVYLRLCHVDYHKGSALTELARLLEIPREGILAAGDNFNDLPMLDGGPATWVTCPVNAILEVKKTVALASGYVAGSVAGAGVAEALRAWPWKLEDRPPV